MGKRAPPLVYDGSMKKYFWGYITKYHMFVNPKDYHAWRYCTSFAQNVQSGKQKFPGAIQELDIKVNFIDGRDNHSHVQVKWISNMDKKFYIHWGSMAVEHMYTEIKFYNEICEDDRNMDNQDDEPEDEISLLV